MTKAVMSGLLALTLISIDLSMGHTMATRGPQVQRYLASHNTTPVKVWIYFVDHGAHSPAEQAAMLADVQLSARAIARRVNRGGGLLVDNHDLPVSRDYIDAVRSAGCRIKHASKYLNAVSAIATRGQIDEVGRLPFVKRIERVGVARRALPPIVKMQSLDPFTAPPQDGGKATDIRFPRRYYGFSYIQARTTNIIPLHEEGLHGEGVLIAVLDTGFNYPGHSAFDHLNIVAEWDFIHNDPVTQDEEEDVVNQHGHGTSSFGAIAGYMPGKLVSAAWGADYVLAKTEIVNEEIESEEDNYVRALEWADSLGVDLVSSSLGYLDWYRFWQMDGNTCVTTIAADIAASKGITIVTAAGNEGGLPWPGIIAPSDGDSVIAVGAVDSIGVVPGFSSRGPTADGRIKPDIVAQGVFVITAYHNDPNGISVFNGTSAATPIAAGAAALLLQKHPNWSPIAIREALRSTASYAHHPNNTFGWGIIDAHAAAYFSITAIGGDQAPSVSNITLSQNAPNPFVPEVSGQTRIQFVIGRPPTESASLGLRRAIQLTVYDVTGRRIRGLFDGDRPEGTFAFGWDGNDDRGASVSSGVYYYRLTVDGASVARRLVLLRK